jgi:hypothetical protein
METNTTVAVLFWFITIYAFIFQYFSCSINPLGEESVVISSLLLGPCVKL